MRPVARGSLAIVRTLVLGVVALSCSADGITGPPALAPAGVAPARASALPPLVITEIMADPSKVADAAGEWIEIYNAGTTAIDLRGWRLDSYNGTNPETHVIASTVNVAAGGYVVLGNNANSGANGGVTEAYSYGGGIQLNNSNTDWVLLRTPAAEGGTVVDSVAYAARTNGTPGSYSAPSGASKAVVDVALDNTIIAGNANWLTTPAGTTYGLGDRGTPGTGPGGTITKPGPVKTVAVTPTPTTVALGATRTLSATARDSAGTAVATTYTWVSSDPSVASVSAAGVVSGLAAGTVTVTATSAEGPFGVAEVKVTDPSAPASVTVGVNSPYQVPVGYVKPFFATVRDGDGRTISPTPKLAWSTTSPSVGSVDSLGYLTGLAVGTLRVIATTTTGAADSSFFTIIPADAPTSALYRDALELGMPTDADPSDDIVIAKRSFTTSYNALRGGPNWVSWNLNASHFGDAPRCDCFSPDRTLPAGVYQVNDLDYRGSGYDRGHMVQSDTRETTLQENAATFLLTNILPQANENNTGPWGKLENYLDTLARRDGKEIFIVAGGIYGPSPATLKGQGRVAIPDYTWKVAVVLSHGADLSHVTSLDSLRVIAVKMPNLTTAGGPASAVGIRGEPWERYVTTVDAIEAETGYDLLALLPDRIERPAEANDRAPVANLAGPSTGVEGSALAFDASASSDPDGDAIEYAWSFGDGETATGAAASHTWADNGTYTVTLTVTDPYGADATISRTVTIANAAPVVSLGAGDTGLEVLSGDEFSAVGGFSDAGASDAPWSWSLAWSDGAPATGTASDATATIGASHRYLASGSYTVTLSVSDKDGATGTRAIAVVVRRRPVAIDLHPAAVNAENETGNAKLKLVIFSDASVDATTIDLASVRVSGTGISVKGNGRLFAQAEDADGDGDADLVIRIDRRELVQNGALEGDTPALVLTATLADGREIEGSVAARVAGR